MEVDRYLSLLIVLPFLEMYLLYQAKVHMSVYRALKQYSELEQNEKQFIKLGIHQEMRILVSATISVYLLTILMDYITNSAVPQNLMSLTLFIVTIFCYPNSFQNGHERVHMKRLQGVIIQCYILMAAFFSAFFALLFDTVFLAFLPVPSVSYVNLRTSDGLPLPKWFTLSRILVYILPTTVYIAVLFHLANFCFLFWCRTFYYAFQRRFWWSIKNDKDVLYYFGDSDVDVSSG